MSQIDWPRRDHHVVVLRCYDASHILMGHCFNTLHYILGSRSVSYSTGIRGIYPHRFFTQPSDFFSPSILCHRSCNSLLQLHLTAFVITSSNHTGRYVRNRNHYLIVLLSIRLFWKISCLRQSSLHVSKYYRVTRFLGNKIFVETRLITC